MPALPSLETLKDTTLTTELRTNLLAYANILPESYSPPVYSWPGQGFFVCLFVSATLLRQSK